MLRVWRSWLDRSVQATAGVLPRVQASDEACFAVSWHAGIGGVRVVEPLLALTLLRPVDRVCLAFSSADLLAPA
jgi:hypothetical protein